MKNMEAKTRQLISNFIGNKQCALPLVAQHQGMDSQTLQRRLHKAGTSYKNLLEQVRVILATRHLEDSRKPITEIAYLLGYSEVSAFARSFGNGIPCHREPGAKCIIEVVKEGKSK